MTDLDRPSVDDQVHKARAILKLNSTIHKDRDRDTQSKIAKAAFVIKKRDETIKALRAEIESLHVVAKEHRRTIFDLVEKLRVLRKTTRESNPTAEKDAGLLE